MHKAFFIWAHRGASALAPENTLTAFRMAERMGAHGIELDVHLSKEGTPVVIHDETLERTTDGQGRVRDWRISDLMMLDAGSWFGAGYAGERVPTLEEVLAQVGDRLRVNIEIKTGAAGGVVCELLEQFPSARVLVSSFDFGALKALRRYLPDLPLGLVVDSPFWRRAVRCALAVGAESLHPAHHRTGPLLMSLCKRFALDVYPWTVDDPWVGRRLQRLGASGLFTNDPRPYRPFASQSTIRNP